MYISIIFKQKNSKTDSKSKKQCKNFLQSYGCCLFHFFPPIYRVTTINSALLKLLMAAARWQLGGQLNFL